MRDSLDDLDLDGGRISEMKSNESPTAAAASANAASQLRRAISGKHVCPFCGTQRDSDMGACPNCSLEDSPTTRSATRSKLGPWYVLQSRNPSAPGMNFETLMVLVQKGRVTARSIVRGPTTGQFWRHAARVKGVSRQFGLCWSCGGDVAKTARACPSCKRLQGPPDDPDVLLEEGVEVSEEEIAEAMWADHGPAGEPVRPAVSRPTPAPTPTPVPQRSAPVERSSSVDRLVARGGVRREVAPGTAREAAAAPAGTGRASLSAAATEELPASNLDMAVFHRPRDRSSRGGVTGKILKSVFVAVLILCSGVVAMASFDPGMREKLITWGERGKTWAATTLDRIRNAPTRPTPNDRVAPAGGELARASDASAGGDVAAGPPAAGSAQSGAPDPAKLRMWELWRVGVDAERKNDFGAAVKAWEQIKALKMPADELPLGFDARLATAKKRAR